MPSLRTTRVSLLARIRDVPDDTGAWSEFVAIYGPAVVQWCRSHGLQYDDAHDVAQDVLVRFWRHAANFRYDPARRFRGYLRQMVVASVSDWSATRRADRAGTGGQAIQDLLSSIPARDGLVRRIEEAFDMELLDLALHEVELRVKPRTWQAFRLLAIDGVPAADVAARLGMTVENSYRARSVVLRLLRRTVARLGRPAGDSIGRAS
ncbi:MAG: sigma-70 family RNA polymerase sigma factor [Planctomycetes bacterium]|nr:sigma-70 family RNA polymerase sigma factor [Planctomycetota bacterium]